VWSLTEVSKTLLLVDDSQMARMTLSAVISKLRPEWTVVETTSAEDALAEAAAQTFDIMLVDMGLPGMDGMELTAKMKAAYPSTAFAIVTANIQNPVRNRAQELGATFIEKPLKPRALLDFFIEVEKRQ
jgi:CheY-like chemotaxis protein